MGSSGEQRLQPTLLLTTYAYQTVTELLVGANKIGQQRRGLELFPLD